MATSLTGAIHTWLRTYDPCTTVAELIASLGTSTVVVPTEATKAKKKKVKDPNAPKRAKSAYLFFCKEARVQLKAAGISGKEVMVKMGEMWRAEGLDKLSYEVAAAEDKVRYTSDMATYSAV